MRIAVIGTGYVGLVTGACLSDVGNKVTCYDIDKDKIEELNNGRLAIFEPGLEDILKVNLKNSNLSFSSDLHKVCEHKDIIFIAVGTPMALTGESDLSQIFSASENIGKTITSNLVVAIKSTVPPGTTHKVKEIIEHEIKFRGLKIDVEVINNPEFLREGQAISDFVSPDRIIIGVENSSSICEIIEELYHPFSLSKSKLMIMDVISSEMTKYASNAILATRISFINEIARICEVVGANINEVRRGMGADSRIGYKYLYPSIGYGGSCLPKDLESLSDFSKIRGYTPQIINSTISVNNQQIVHFTNRIINYIQSEHKGECKVTIWGLSFKPDTDDIRESPSIYLIKNLLKKNILISTYDPKAMKNMRNIFSSKVKYHKDKYDALQNSNILILLTEWKEFRAPSLTRIKKLMKSHTIFDGRNIYRKDELFSMGFQYYQIGVKDKY